MSFDFDLLSRRNAVVDPLRQFCWERLARPLDPIPVDVESKHVRRFTSDGDGESAIAAAELEHAPSPEDAEPTKRGEMRPYWIEHGRHLSYA